MLASRIGIDQEKGRYTNKSTNILLVCQGISWYVVEQL